MKPLIPLLFFSLLSQSSFALIGSQSAIKFYKTPRSFFPSGEANLRELEKNRIKDHFEFSYLVQKEKKQFWVQASSVVRDIHLSEFVYANNQKQTYRILQISGSSVYASPVNGGSNEWLSITQLTPLPADLGVAVTLTATQVREAPSWKSDSVLSLPTGSRLQVLKIEDTWAQVTFESVGKVAGWVDLSNLVLKYDFAAFALWGEKNKWLSVLYREGSDLITSDHKRIPLSDVKGLITKPDLVISMVTNEDEQLLLRQNLKVLRTEAQTWTLSKLNGHGQVFWKKNSLLQQADNHLSASLTVDELMKREVVSVSFHPKNPNLGVVSAGGIYLTRDGKTWNQISRFGQQDFPVLIDEQGYLYIGSHKSADLGKTFSPYFRMELLAQVLEQKQKATAQQLKIKGLSNPRPGILRLELETNSGLLRVAARSDKGFITKWDYD